MDSSKAAAPTKSEPRPRLREDGIPTRADLRFMSPAEKAITSAMRAVEEAGRRRH